MPRLRHELTLAPGMSVADVGAGRGEMTVALPAEVGPSGPAYATDIDPEALEQIRSRVAAPEFRDFLADDVARYLPSIMLVKPEATYLAWLDCRGAVLDDPFTFFLTRAMVAFDDGATFGKPDTAHVRLSLGTPRAHLPKGLR